MVLESKDELVADFLVDTGFPISWNPWCILRVYEK
jgi:hypothetical protein